MKMCPDNVNVSDVSCYSMFSIASREDVSDFFGLMNQSSLNCRTINLNDGMNALNSMKASLFVAGDAHPNLN